jgi:hypothetical protein
MIRRIRSESKARCCARPIVRPTLMQVPAQLVGRVDPVVDLLPGHDSACRS